MTNLPSRGSYLAPRQISRLVIMGGTHGNERTGVHALQYIDTNRDEFKTGGIKTIETLFGNPPAILRNARYIDADLKRCFKYDYAHPMYPDDIKQFISQSPPYELIRSLEIRQQIGALYTPVDFLIDLHTTTSNMGNCLIISDSDPWTLALCNHVADTVPDCRIVVDHSPRKEDLNSSSLALNSITLEMGPFQQGIADTRAVDTALFIIKTIIKTIDQLNGKDQAALTIKPSSPVFQTLPIKVDYPRDARGFNTAFIHKDFLYRDFKPLHVGSVIFKSHDGKDISLKDTSFFPPELITRINNSEEISPIFTGESAYVEKGIAFIPVIGLAG